MELFVTAVNGWKAARVLILRPNTSVIAPFHRTLYGELFELYVNYRPCLHYSLQHCKIHVQTDNLKHEM